MVDSMFRLLDYLLNFIYFTYTPPSSLLVLQEPYVVLRLWALLIWQAQYIGLEQKKEKLHCGNGLQVKIFCACVLVCALF